MATDTAGLAREVAGVGSAPVAVPGADSPDTESPMAAASDAVPWPWDWDWREPPHRGDTDAAVA